MSLLLFLNDLSCGTPVDRHEATAAMSDLAQALGEIRRHRGDTALISTARFPQWQICANYSAIQWMNSGSHAREQARALLQLQNRAPFQLPLEGLDSESEYTHKERVSPAFQAADIHHGMTVSLPVDEDWGEGWLPVTCTRTKEDDDGNVLLHTSDMVLRHCSRTEHVILHESWFKGSGLSDLATGADIWGYRETYFPDLVFLPRVEEDLNALDPSWVEPVKTVLLKLQEAAAAWEPSKQRTPEYRTHVTPESNSRRQRGVADFQDLDGCTRLFEFHARFTPGAGRLHFRPVPEERKLRIAYIGRKLES